MTRHGHLVAAIGLVACLGLSALDAHAGPGHRGFLAGPCVHGHGWGYAPPHPSTRFGTIWRHHGLGEGGYCHADGVRSFHGLGDGYCYEPGPARYWWLEAAPPPPRYAPPPAPWHAPPPAPPASQPPPDAAAPPAGGEASAARTSRGWSLLERGDARAARRDFAVLALRAPEDSMPRVGFALASAMLGEDETAIWSMRRAFEIDAVAVAGLAVNDALARRLRSLIGRYEAIASQPGAGTDALFMAAALHLLRGGDERAAAVIAEAVAKGDRQPATLALRDLVETVPGEAFGEAGDLDA